MHLLRFNPEDKTLREVPPGEFVADPACHYFYVQGKRAEVPIATTDGIGEIVWQHPDYHPPSPANDITVDQMLALEDQIRDGALTLAEALEEINGKPAPAADAQQLALVEQVGCLVATFASEGLPGDNAVPTAREIFRLIAKYLRSNHPNHYGRGTDWADYFDGEADDA